MKKLFALILTVFFLVSSMFIIQADELTTSNNDLSESGEKVCCKVYGLGSQMKQVNIRYGWIEEDECVTPEEFVGGGREIVNDDYCEIKTQYQAKILTQAKIKTATQIRNRLRINQTECPNNCSCVGSTIKCELEGRGRNMTVYAGKSGNTIVQVKGVNMSTNVTLYKSEGKVFGMFRNNQTREVNLLPDHVQEKIRERIRARLENQTIELDEDGIYQIQGRKKARLFFLFPVREKMGMQIDSETGELIKIRNPWWGFLARDISEEEEIEEEED